MSGIRCKECGRDLDEIGQDNMSCTSEPLCEDCWNERQGRAAESLRREVRDLRFENARLREKLDAKVEDAVDPTWVGRMRNTAVQNLRADIELVYATSRERALALTKLDECELWLTRCKTKRAAAQAAADAAQAAAMPCLEDDEARGFKLPDVSAGDVSVEVDADRVAEAAAKSLRNAMGQVMRMAVR